MQKQLIDYLVCPQCKGQLIWQESTKELICFVDRLAFAVQDDIPVMLVTEARTLSSEEQPC